MNKTVLIPLNVWRFCVLCLIFCHVCEIVPGSALLWSSYLILIIVLLCRVQLSEDEEKLTASIVQTVKEYDCLFAVLYSLFT